MRGSRISRPHVKPPAGADRPAPRHGLARVLSKQGICSRTEAARWIVAGRVSVDGRVVMDPEFPVVQGRQRIAIDGHEPHAQPCLYLMLNKPRGVVTTAKDEKGRDTVYRCLDGAGLPWLAPVGRLDRASEGLLLFSNDPEWAACVLDPQAGADKTYHVQIDALPAEDLPKRLMAGIVDADEHLRATSVRVLRSGARNAWLEVMLDEGKNRHIRRLLAAHGFGVLRLVRTAIGSLPLGDLPKGSWRMLADAEVDALASRGRHAPAQR